MYSFFLRFFISCNFIFSPNECPGLLSNRVDQGPGHSLGKKLKLHEMKNKKKLHVFSYDKNMANFEGFR